MKKVFMLLFLGIFTLTLSACNQAQVDQIKAVLDLDSAQTILAADSESLGFGAYTTAGLLSNLNSQTPTAQAGFTRLSNKTYVNLNEGTTLVEDKLALLNEYMSLFEAYTSEDANAVQAEQVESTDPNFAFEIHYTVQNFDGTFSTYVMFYNIVEVVDYEDLDEDDLDDEVDEDDLDDEVDEDDLDDEVDEDDEEKGVIYIEGKMVVNGMEYSLEGKVEVEDGETKTEVKAFIDGQNYVKMDEEIEFEESKFKFEIVQNGVLIQETEIEVEDEDNELKVILRFTIGDEYSEYSLKREFDGTELEILIEYNVDGVTGEIEVTEVVAEDGTVSYSFYIREVQADGSEIEIEIEQDKVEYESETEEDDSSDM